MIVDTALHFGLELVGTGTVACVRYGCRNADHNHRGVVGLLARNRSARLALNGTMMLAMAALTVKIVG